MISKIVLIALKTTLRNLEGKGSKMQTVGFIQNNVSFNLDEVKRFGPDSVVGSTKMTTCTMR